MAQVDILLDEEDDDVNSKLLNFYQGNRQFLNVPLHRIPDYLKFVAAALYYETSLYDYEWRGLLEDLGVNPYVMIGLDFKSSKTGILPIYLALNGVLKNNNSFGDFIDALCRREKFEILRKLKPFAEELVKEHHSVSGFGPRPSAPNYSILSIPDCLSDPCCSEVRHSTDHGAEYELESCQGNGMKYVNDHKTAFEHIQNSEIKDFGNKKRLSATSNFQINQSVDELISVFIMHSMVDKKYAKKLAACLGEKNFRVITSANIYYYLRENPTMIMRLINEKVDFVIPVLSESFMKQIKPTGYNAAEERDIESVANTFMYDCLLNEYSSNFFNRRVRPVCYSLVNKELTNRDQILSWPCYLPYGYLRNERFLKFLKLLRRSKRRIEN